MKYKLLSLLGAVLFLTQFIATAQVITLGTAANFVLFTTNGAVTNSGTAHLTHLTGNVGSNLSGSVTGFGNIDGQLHAFDAATIQATADVNSVYDQLDALTPTATHVILLGGGETLTPGVYHILANATLNTTLTLDALGNPNAVFVFQIDGTLSTTTLSKVKIINGGLACNVFWKVEGVVSLDPGTTLVGTIVAHNAAINMTSLDTLEGRALSVNGAISVGALMAYKPIGCGSAVLNGPAAPALASVGQFGVFSSIGAVTSTPITYVTGDVGSNSTTSTGFNPLFVTGTIHTPPDAATAAAAGSLTIVYDYLVALPLDIELIDPINFGFDLVLTPHTYHLNGITKLNGNVILNAQGNANAVFVIQIDGAFSTTMLSKVILINGTQWKNVYWKIDGAVDILSNSVFNGNIIAAGAISLATGDTMYGRALTIGGAIAINGSYLSNAPKCTAAPITGANSICTGSTTRLSDADAGGTWTSSNTTMATIGSSSGIVTGILPGITTVTYTSTLTCTSTFTMTVIASPSPITGPGNVCIGSTIGLSNATTGGTWSSSNTSLATAGTLTGIVRGIAAGAPVIAYTIPGGCVATKTVTVNPLTNAGTITGPSGVCVGATIALTDAVAGGVWSSSNTRATVSASGIVTGVATGIDTIRYRVTGTCGPDTATKIITISTTSNPGTITGPSTVCTGSAIALSNAVTGGTWSAANTTATVSNSGVVTGIAPGANTITYTVNNGCGLATTTKTVTVNATPNAGTITGLSTVCTGSSIILSDNMPGGVWSSNNTNASVLGGVVTGITAGTATISYTVTNVSCTATATKIITVTTATGAGTITGPSTVCAGFSIPLSNNVPGGVWSSTNTTASVSNTGVVTGATAGIDTIRYTVTNSCGTAVSTKTVTVNPLPDAGTISGPSGVCVGATIALTDNAPGGVWTSTNTSNATVSNTGVVTGVAAGSTVIRYQVTNSCGTIIASKFITVNTAANAGTITGPSSVCTGATITLLNAVTGGTWSSNNTNSSVSPGGVLTGNTPGASVITYTVNNGCGTAATTTTITINPSPDAGTITGPSGVCVGSVITLSDNAAGGIWSSSNTNASVVAGIVTGNTPGTATISYTVTNICGTVSATKLVSVNTGANAGTITGPSSVCTGSTITLLDAVAGGTWSSNNTNSSVSSGGVVTGNTPGTSVITYTVNNGCGTAATTTTITVNPLPDAGTITGPSVVCVGSVITLSDNAAGGIWSSSNTNASVAAGIVTGNTPGTAVISYTVTNGCGTVSATKLISVNTGANAGTLSGPSAVCSGSSVTLTETIPGGAWSSSNTAIASVVNGVVTGNTTGNAIISYTVNNSCGTAVATHTITVTPLPDAGTITGPSSVCVGSSISLTNSATGGVWSSTNTNATVIGGFVTGRATGTDTIVYSVTNACGTMTASKIISVTTPPNAGTITGSLSVCAGSVIILNNAIPGGTWSASNTSVTVANGVVTGVTPNTSIISYTVTNGCGSAIAVKTVTVNALPAMPVIAIKSPAAVCTGVMYQNFGAATASAAGTNYNWTVTNGTLWAQGTMHQNALVNFDMPGAAIVTLSATIAVTGCTSRSNVVVTVGPSVSETPTVTYFNNDHFVCTPNTENAYQWGYDDAFTLDSTILTGEINQDYVNTNPDFTGKRYWVMTSAGGCAQKTYYNIPTAVQNVNAGAQMSVYPNPANEIVNVVVSNIAAGKIQVDIMNTMGQKVATMQAAGNKAAIDITALTPGSYFVTCYNDGIKIAGARFTKN